MNVFDLMNESLIERDPNLSELVTYFPQLQGSEAVTLDFADVSAASDPLGAEFVSLKSAQSAYVAFGAAPVASPADTLLTGGVEAVFAVDQADKLAAIEAEFGGSGHILISPGSPLSVIYEIPSVEEQVDPAVSAWIQVRPAVFSTPPLRGDRVFCRGKFYTVWNVSRDVVYGARLGLRQ